MQTQIYTTPSQRRHVLFTLACCSCSPTPAWSWLAAPIRPRWSPATESTSSSQNPPPPVLVPSSYLCPASPDQEDGNAPFLVFRTRRCCTPLCRCWRCEGPGEALPAAPAAPYTAVVEPEMLLAARSTPLRRAFECRAAARTKAGEQGPREPAEEPNPRDELAPAALVDEARTRELPPWPPSTAAAELSTRSTIVAEVAEPGNNHRPGTEDFRASIKL